MQDKAIPPPDVTLVQVATPSRERVDAYRELRQQVETTVGRINGEYAPIGSPAVHYQHHSYPQEEMAALYLAADVMLVTPLRDGMNLVAKEYVTCRHDLGGALVLSEFTGAYHELHQAFVCNPHDIEGLKQTILKAINTPAHDKARIMKALRRRVADHDVRPLGDPVPRRAGGRPEPARGVDPRAPSAHDGETVMSDRATRTTRTTRTTPEESAEELRAALERAAKAPTLLVASDFDGALAEFTVDPDDSAPAPGAMDALRGLAALPDTHVAVASGRDVRTLRDLTGVGSAESITLIGSHGAESTKPNVATEGRLDDEQRALLDDLTAQVAELIDRHPGARLERKRAAVAVHTRGLPKADAEAALREAAAIGEDRRDVRMLRGKSVVELSVSHADKGTRDRRARPRGR